MPKTILTVDDSASVRQMIGFTLREAGYSVLEAVDGQDALTKLNGSVDLIISDVNMPNMNGLDLVRNVRASGAHKYVPILMLTTESLPQLKQEGKAAGATGWIVKPFRPDQLLSVVQRVLA
jgi:two-component system, chemotaxis family, chemotaxis protein CheY